MKKFEINVNVEISTDEKYCDRCQFNHENDKGFFYCELFQDSLKPFRTKVKRCRDCLEHEAGLD